MPRANSAVQHPQLGSRELKKDQSEVSCHLAGILIKPILVWVQGWS